MTPSHFNTYQSSYNNPQFQQQVSPSQSPQYGLIHPTQHYLTTYPSTPLEITYPSAPYPNAYLSIIDSGLAVLVFKQGDDPIDAINKMMSFLSTIVTSRFPSTYNQLRNSSNPRQQATIHDGRVFEQLMARSGTDLKMAKLLASASIFIKIGVLQPGTKKYAELSATEKIQADYDMKSLPISMERVQLLMQGTSLTKQERECKLYDAFDKFAHIKGESLHQYYLRFTQLINDMNIYKMKLEQFQVNTKFLNSLPPEWSKFVIDVKLVRDLHTTNFDQLNAYLEQHELYANEVQTRANTSGTGGNNSGQQRVLKCFNCQMEGHMARQCPKTKRKRDATWFRDKVLLVEAQGNGKVLNEEELKFLADSGIAEGLVTQSVITYNAAYQADDLDACDSDYDEISIAKAVLMANLSSYSSDVLSEVPHSDNTNNDMLNQSVQETPYSEQPHLVNYPENEITTVQDINSSTQQDAMILFVFEQLSHQVTNCNKVNKDNLIANESLSAELERYKERVKLLEEKQNLDLGTREKLIIDDIIRAIGFQNPFDLKKAQQIRPMLYDCNVIAKETNVISIADSEETLMFEDESRSKMLLKQNFGKCFVPKQELFAEQAFHFQMSNPSTDSSDASPVKVPSELPKVSLVNASLKKLKFHLAQFDSVVKKRITPDALTKGEWQFEHTKC
ncbi:reverse transcriptase domain-containing protein [Tanacetum coccineum]